MKKAKHHHRLAGQAMANGDHAAAMHHTGHMLAALRADARGTAGAPATMPEGDGDAGARPTPDEAPAKPSFGLRARLAQTKQS